MSGQSPPPARAAYRDRLVTLMTADPRVVCLDTDTGLFSGVDFAGAAGRYINVGIAEHTMMGVAAGLAASGWIPYVNTMAAFATSRAVEAVKVDIAYTGLPVRIVATHGGVSAGHLGPTHHALEDLAVMRAFPGMTVVVPGDARGAVELLDQVAGCPGPVYVRLGRKATPALPAGPAPVLGRLQPMRNGRDVLIVATGPLPVLRSLAAADLLAAAGELTVGVVQAHTVKPFDASGLVEAASDARLVVTVEEHWRGGGLGSVVAELLAESTPRRLLRLGMPDAFVTQVGSPEELLASAGLSATGIADAIRDTLAETTTPAARAADASRSRRGATSDHVS